jgi:hypothetical protein
MDKTSLVAREAINLLLEALGDDSTYAETVDSFKDSIQKLDNIIHYCEQDEHRICSLWRKIEKRESPCPCSQCDETERETKVDSIRQALIENAAEPRPILPTLKISEIPQTE